MIENKQSSLPKRTVFGLPHNYFFSSTKKKIDVNVSSSAGEARRASPLFIHVHKLSNQEYLAVQLLLPAVFLDSNEHRMELKSKGTQRLSITSDSFDYGVIRDYMTLPKYETDRASYPGFTSRQQIWPIKEAN
jgi:CRISPR-associated protein Cmr1